MTTPVWLHDELDKGAAEATIQPLNKSDGLYSIRKRPNAEGQYVLMVVYKDKPTHHLIINDGGVMKVNKKDYGGAETIEELVNILEKPGVKGWPVPLSQPIPKSITAELSWLHEPMDNATANNLMSGNPDGTFLVRKRSGHDTDFVLSVIYKSKNTHHLVSKKGSALIVNKQSYNDAETILALVAELCTPSLPKSWPVRLLKFIPAGPSSSAASSTKKKSVKRTSTSKDSDDDQPWLHSPMSNTKAEKLFTTMDNGIFLIRERGADHPMQYVISVVYQEKPTHHLATFSEEKESFLVNKKPIENTKTIGDVVAALRKKRKFWPVPLTEHITNEEAAPSVESNETPVESKPKRDDSEAEALAAQMAQQEAARAANAKREQEILEKERRQEQLAQLKLKEEAEARAAKAVAYVGETWVDEEDGGVMGFGDSGDESIVTASIPKDNQAQIQAAAVEAERKAEVENRQLAERLQALEAKRVISPQKKDETSPTKESSPKRKMSHQDYLRSIGVLPPTKGNSQSAPTSSQAPPSATINPPIADVAKTDKSEPTPAPASVPEPKAEAVPAPKKVAIPKVGEEYTYSGKKKWTPPVVGKQPEEAPKKPKIHPSLAAPPPPPEFIARYGQKKEEWTGVSEDEVGMAQRRSEIFGGAVSNGFESSWKKEKRLKREAAEDAAREEKAKAAAKAKQDAEEAERLRIQKEEEEHEANKVLSLKDRMSNLGIGKITSGSPAIRRRGPNMDEIKKKEAETAEIARRAAEEKKAAEAAERERIAEARRQQSGDVRRVTISERQKSFTQV